MLLGTAKSKRFTRHRRQAWCEIPRLSWDGLAGHPVRSDRGASEPSRLRSLPPDPGERPAPPVSHRRFGLTVEAPAGLLGSPTQQGAISVRARTTITANAESPKR